MNRRSFLGTAALATLAARAQMPPPKEAAIRSSAAVWTLSGSIEEKLEAVGRAGIQSVEFSSENAEWSAADVERMKRLTQSFRLGINAIGAAPRRGEAVFSMVDPEGLDSLLAEVAKNIEMARDLDAPMLLISSGPEMPGRSREEQFAAMVESAKRCGDLAAKADRTLVVEPFKGTIGTAPVFLATCTDGLALIKEADHPHVRLLFDIYHEYTQTGDVIPTLEEAAPYTAIFHVADSPGRHEPGTGKIDFPSVYAAIRDADFKGYIAMEYRPTIDPVRSLIQSVDAMRAVLNG